VANPAGPVTNLTASPSGSGRISLAWTCSPTGSACSGGQTVTSFQVSISPPATVPSPPLPAAGSSSYQMAISGLSNGTTYAVTVLACNATGCTPSSNAATSSVEPFGAPGSPGVSGSVNGTSIMWSWSPPGADGGRPVTGYQVSVDGTLVQSSGATSYSANYGYSQMHSIAVVAVNAGGDAGPAGVNSETTGGPPPQTYPETTGGVTHTFSNYSDAGGQGASIPSNQTVQISCKVTGFKVADGNTWWYKVASSPWSNGYYASADAFYNNGATSGSLHGTPWVDSVVPNC
jgi:hypothetical protein